MNEIKESYRLNAIWEPDCNGKKGFDGYILSIDTSYWPPGYAGAFTVVNNPGEPLRIEDPVPAARPAEAWCSLSLHSHPNHEHEMGELRGDHHYDCDYVKFAEGRFTGPTFEDVARQVEEYAQGIMDRVTKALRAEFGQEVAP